MIRPNSKLTVLSAGVVVPAIVWGAACGGGSVRPAVPVASASVSAPSFALVNPLLGSRWMPESLEGAESISTLSDGTKRGLIGRLRVEQTPSGAIRRASELLPSRSSSSRYQPYGYGGYGYQPYQQMTATSMVLPERLGGGYLFIGSSGGTQLWKAQDYLGKLTPLTQIRFANAVLVAGPDRLIAYAQGTERPIGIDINSGRIVPPVGLPSGPHINSLVFADAWRGAAFLDMQGVVATFDAGATWHPVGIQQQPSRIELSGDNIQVVGWDGNYLVDVNGHVSKEANPNTPPPQYPYSPYGTGYPSPYSPYAPYPTYSPYGVPPPPTATVVAPATSASRQKVVIPKPFGSSPLRTVVENGWPMPDGTAVMVHGGRLARVRLEDGEVLEATASLMKGEEDAQCTPLRFGRDAGFVCGSPLMGTAIYALAEPLNLVPIARFAHPRAVISSGNGWLVVKGSCSADAKAEPVATSEPRPYCVISPTGTKRELRARGENVERVVALSNGRVAVLVPPRPGDDGQVTILPAGAGKPTAIALKTPEDEGLALMLRQGLWLDGVFEANEEELGAWVEAAGAMIGVRIHMGEGAITPGAVRNSNETYVSGPIGFSVTAQDAALESLDGGITWNPVEMPTLGQGRPNIGRFCTWVGCVVPFDKGSWLRIGWGPGRDQNDFASAPDVTASYTDSVSTHSYNYRCELARVDLAPKVVTKPEPISPREPVAPYYPPGYGMIGAIGAVEPESTSWESFWGIAPPTKGKGFRGEMRDSVGVNGYFSLARLYVWYPRAGGNESVRNGRILARFIDRFETGKIVHSTAASVPSWGDEEKMKEALGLGDRGYTQFAALTDPGGGAALMTGCHSNICDLYSLQEGKAVEFLAGTEDPYFQVLQQPSASAVRLDDTWYVARSISGSVSVWRVDSSGTKLLAKLPRVTSPIDTVRLVRRAKSRGLGLMVQGDGTYGKTEREIYVLPINPDTGALGHMTKLGPTDFTGKAPRKCAPEEDGWLIETAFNVPVAIRELTARVSFSDMRLRVERNRACVEAIGARLIDLPESSKPKTPGVASVRPMPPRPGPAVGPAAPPAHAPINANDAIPLVAIDSEGNRVVANCAP